MGDEEAAVALPYFVWERVLLHVQPLAHLGRVACVSVAFRELVYDPYFMVRYWRERERVWDVLRYKRPAESWAAFCARASAERTRLEKKVAQATQAIDKARRENDPRLASLLLTRRGLMYLTNLRDFEAALADFEEAFRVQEDRGLPSALNNMAVAYLYLGNLKADVRFFQMAESKLLEGGQTKTSSVSGGNLCVSLIKQGRFEEAVRVAKIATQNARRESMHNANAFHHQAFALYSLGLHNRAVRAANNALKWKPDYGEARFTRGLCLLALGKKDEAQEDFERALSQSRESSVWSYCHMYASSGEPTCEGFAPRQSASLETIEEMGADSASVSSAEDSGEDFPRGPPPIAHAHQIPDFFRHLLQGGHGDFSDESDEDESDEDEDGEDGGSSEGGRLASSDEGGPMFLVADPRAD